jgi:hypothetical protein
VYYKILLVKFHSLPMFECTINESFNFNAVSVPLPIIVSSVLPFTTEVCPLYQILMRYIHV